MADPRAANRSPRAGVFTNAPQLQAWLRSAGTQAQLEAARAVKHYTLLLETRVKGAASGRPGPRVRTGNYRRSINSTVVLSGQALIGTVGTAAPQARRLEYGFVGADRLGRVYDQPPFPHFGPAGQRTVAEFAAAMERIAGRIK